MKNGILYDNGKCSGSWLDKDEAPKHSLKPNIHKKKLMVTVWWSIHGLIHYSFIKSSQPIMEETYCNQLDNMIKWENQWNATNESVK